MSKLYTESSKVWTKKEEGIAWIDKESEKLWKADRELSLQCGEAWVKTVLATERFATEVQRAIRESKKLFDEVVEKVLLSLKEIFKLNTSQINIVISNLAWSWIYGQSLRIWNNKRFGVSEEFQGLVFSD